MGTATTTRGAASSFRPDIEGLRAVAVLAVLLCHAQFGFAEGGFAGVDVFYVISGFLITGLLVREVDSRGTISLVGFYARRARRLLPAAALVIVAVLLTSAVVFNPVRQEAVNGDAIASSLYYVNWRFVAQSADYFAAAPDQSPLQHYWSLAVEEQFYLVWPLLLMSLAALWRRRGRPPSRKAAAGAIGALTVASFLYSALWEPASPGEAYFSSFTRAWELGLGGLVALAPRSSLRPRPAFALGTAGLAAIAAAVLLFDETTRFPGVAALLPCLGAAALIRAGRPEMPYRPLTGAPIQYVGRISYCLYLWHWPALIFVAVETGPLSLAESAAIVFASFIPAVLTHHLIEQPIHRSRALLSPPWRAIGVGAACTVAGLATVGAVAAAKPDYRTASVQDAVGAKALKRDAPIQATATALRPNPVEVAADKGRLADDGCLVDEAALNSGECSYGPDDSDQKVVLFGDSHALQFFPAIEEIAEDENWLLTGLTKQSCTPASISVWSGVLNGSYSECDEWRENSLERIEQIDGLDLVIVASANFYHVAGGSDSLSRLESRPLLIEAYSETLERLQATGASVVMLVDVPTAPSDVTGCVSEHLDSLSECTFEIEDSPTARRFDVPAGRTVPGVTVVDTRPLVCPDEICRGVIGNVIVYREEAHITATFSETLGPFIERRLPTVR